MAAMTRTQRALAGAGAAALVALSVSACKSSDASADTAAAPGPPSVEDFCGIWEDALNGLGTTGPTGPTDEQWESVRSELTKLAELGAPEELSDEATDGLDIFADALTGLSGADMRRLRGAESLPGVTDDDEALARQFNSEAAGLCESTGSAR